MTCECGSIFFNEVKAKTFRDGRFNFYGEATRANIEHEDTVNPVAICIFCGKVHIPSTSFSGMNSMNRNVQIYGELLEQQERYNAQLKELCDSTLVEVSNVKAEQNSGNDTKSTVRRGRARV